MLKVIISLALFSFQLQVIIYTFLVLRNIEMQVHNYNIALMIKFVSDTASLIKLCEAYSHISFLLAYYLIEKGISYLKTDTQEEKNVS